MERRKIQQVGGSTYTVSLPKAWAERVGVTAGSTVNIDVHGDEQLVVEPASPATGVDSRLSFAAGECSPSRLGWTVRAAYAAGVEELVLRAAEGFSVEQRRAVEQAATGFVGVALTTESETELVVRALLDAAEVSVVQSVRQLRFTALSMHRDAMAALTDGTDPRVADRHEEATRLAAMVDRHFGRGLVRLDEVDALGLSRPELFELRTVARALLRVAEEATTLAGAAAAVDDLPGSVSAEALETTGREAHSAVEQATDVVVGDAGAETAMAALEARDSVRASLAEIDDRLAAANADYGLAQVVDALDRTARHAGDIAEFGLRTTMRRDGGSEAVAEVE